MIRELHRLPNAFQVETPTGPTLLLGYKSPLFQVFGVEPHVFPLLQNPSVETPGINPPYHSLTSVRNKFFLNRISTSSQMSPKSCFCFSFCILSQSNL